MKLLMSCLLKDLMTISMIKRYDNELATCNFAQNVGQNHVL